MTERRDAKPPQKQAATRLRDALDKLVHSDSGGRMRRDITITELCQFAGVSRNSLYRYHRPILADLAKHQRRGARARRKTRELADRRRLEKGALLDRIGKLAALVDHYYAAYRETVALLERRERDLAELRRRIEPALITVVG
jgi:hypothetical protein